MISDNDLIPIATPTHDGSLTTQGEAVQLTEADKAAIEQTIEHAAATNTRRMYGYAVASFLTWQARTPGYRHTYPSPAMIAAYLVDLARRGKTPATIQLYRSGIRDWARKQAPEAADPCASKIVADAMAGIRRRDRRAIKQAPPATAEVMGRIIPAILARRGMTKGKQALTEAGQARRNHADAALLMTMRDAMLRISEAQAIRWGDIHRNADGSATLTIRRSKTDQTGEGADVYLSAQTVDMLSRYRKLQGKAKTVPGLHVWPIGLEAMRQRLKKAVIDAGEPRLTGHSFRVGMACDLAATGAELPALMQAGRWTSSVMPARYTRAVAATDNAVARYYRRNGKLNQIETSNQTIGE